MAKIFFSYSHQDEQLATVYMDALKRLGHEINKFNTAPRDSSFTFEISLRSWVSDADYVLVFLTKNLAVNGNAFAEMEVVLEFKKPVLVLTSRSMDLPDWLTGAQTFFINESNPDVDSTAIDELLKKEARRTDAKTDQYQAYLTPEVFAKEFYNYLGTLKPGSKINDWHCEGLTDIAYSTPAGPWDKAGFLFNDNDYRFILRSVARPGNSYLVVESVNLAGQLANLSLNNSDKFKNDKGQVQVIETYDMTVGYGRRARKDVRKAFLKTGMAHQVITAFDEQSIDWEQILLDILTWAQYREEAKDILLKDSNIAIDLDSPPQFWFLKIYGPNWGKDIQEGSEAVFHADFAAAKPRPEYELYQQLRVGEQGIAVDDSPENEIVFSFEVIEALERGNDDRERFMIRILKSRFRYNFTAGDHQAIYAYTERFAKDGQRLYPLPQADFEVLQILLDKAPSPHPGEPPIFNTVSLSQVFSDSAGQEIEDSLDFQKDVDALAAVIVYREVTPPLAIGLFGNWGTGKSFFMHKLQKKIYRLSADPGEVFCQKVLQINFNSWHYSDSNLWASLITKIFEDLERYGKDRPDELKDLFKHLNSTKELISETKIEKRAVERNLTLLQDEKAVFEKRASEQAGQLKNLSFKTILGELIENSSVQDDLKELKAKYQFLNLEVYEDIEQQVEEVEGFAGQLRKAFAIIPSLCRGRRIFMTALLFALLIGGCYYLQAVSSAVQVLFDKLKWVFYLASAMLAGSINLLAPARRIVRVAYQHLRTLKVTIDHLKIKANETFAEQRQEINTRIADATTKSANIDLQIEQLQLRQQKLQDDINDITSGKKVIRFIESRVADERYTSSLGIISWVRKDFEQLDYLLGQQSSARLDQANTTIPLAFELERIILYIDDLDRCHESLVVKVLEAINLLLAFPLFVVVVGVDPRWMHNALHLKYPHLRNGLINKVVTNDSAADTDEGRMVTDELTATSSDYLEKIFQIPFALKPMTQASKAALIAAQLKVKEFVLPSAAVAPDIRMRDVANQPVTQTDTADISDGLTIAVLPADQPYILDAGISKDNTVFEIKKLLITEAEEQFMQGLAYLIGDSPRTIKRFINIYRILRSHEGFQLDKGQEQSYYFAAMVMLAVITGRPRLTRSFNELVRLSEDSRLFIMSLAESTLVTGKGDQTLLDLLYIPKDVLNHTWLTEQLQYLPNRMFKTNLDLVNRFSFNRP